MSDQVLKTTDYGRFHLSTCNRKVNRESAYYRELRESVRRKGQLVPIVVDRLDGKLIVTEGQHRLEVCKELGIEVKYIVSKGSADDIIDMNIHKKWTPTDYRDAFSNDNPSYRYFGELQKETGLSASVLYQALYGKSMEAAVFNSGKMQLTYNQMVEFRKQLPLMMQILNSHEGKNRTHLRGTKSVGTLSEIMRQEGYDHEHFFERIKDTVHIPALTTRDDAEAFLVGKYNYRLASEKKIKLSKEG